MRGRIDRVRPEISIANAALAATNYCKRFEPESTLQKATTAINDNAAPIMRLR